MCRILSARYNRSKSHTSVILQHSLYMMFRRSASPAYTLTITALPHLVQGSANKHNILLIQNRLINILRVNAERGYVQFVSVPEDCCGSDGRTVAGRLDQVVRPMDVASVSTTKQGRKSKV